jgi:tetratricopeptide (TPR) repeat protein
LDAEKGLALEQRSVAIDENALPDGHPRRVLDLRDLAGFYEFRKPVEADRLYQQALSLLDTAQGLTSLERMFTYSSAADFYDRQKNLSQAEALYRQAVDASQHLQLSMRIWPLNMRAQLARVLAEEGKRDEAHALLNEPPEPIPAPPFYDTYSPRPDLSGPMGDLARAGQYVQEGNPEDAEISYLSAVSALEGMKSESMQVDGLLEETLNGLAGLYNTQHCYAESETLYLRAFRLWEADASAPHPTRPAPYPSLQPLMLMYKDQGRLPEIEPLYLRAIDLLEQRSKTDDFTVGLIANCKSGRSEPCASLRGISARRDLFL